MAYEKKPFMNLQCGAVWEQCVQKGKCEPRGCGKGAGDTL